MMDAMIRIFVYMLIPSSLCSELDTNIYMYDVQKNVQMTGTENMSTKIHATSLVECATTCTGHKLCCMSSYKHSTKECFLDTTGSCQAQTESANGVTLLVIAGLSGWERFKGHCYYFSDEELNWPSAEDKCVTMGAHLVKIENAEENIWIKEKGEGRDLWIGLNDIAEEGKWRWISDNSEIGFQDWNPIAPNGGTFDNCVQLWKGDDSSYHWDDTTCKQDFQGFVCKKEIEQSGP